MFIHLVLCEGDGMMMMKEKRDPHVLPVCVCVSLVARRESFGVSVLCVCVCVCYATSILSIFLVVSDLHCAFGDFSSDCFLVSVSK